MHETWLVSSDISPDKKACLLAISMKNLA